MMADPVFTVHHEEELLHILTQVHNGMFKLSESDIRRMVYEYAELSGRMKTKVVTDEHEGVHICKKIAFRGTRVLEEYKYLTTINKKAKPTLGTGQWVTDFLLRNAKTVLPIYKRFMYEISAEEFFDQFESVCIRANFSADRIYNAVEFKIPSDVFEHHCKDKSIRSLEVTSCLESTFSGVAEICASAAEAYMPPTVVFSRTNHNSSQATSPRGCMKPSSFYKWFEQFIYFSKPTKQKPVLLLFHGEAAYMKSVSFVVRALENHVVLFSCPLHIAHDMQPLDVSFVPYLSAFYFEVAKQWVKENPGTKMAKEDTLALFFDAFTRAKSPRIKINGFLMSGIYPINRYVFPPEPDQGIEDCTDFAGMEATVSPDNHDVCDRVYAEFVNARKRKYATKGDCMDFASTTVVSPEDYGNASGHVHTEVQKPQYGKKEDHNMVLTSPIFVKPDDHGNASGHPHTEVQTPQYGRKEDHNMVLTSPAFVKPNDHHNDSHRIHTEVVKPEYDMVDLTFPTFSGIKTEVKEEGTLRTQQITEKWEDPVPVRIQDEDIEDNPWEVNPECCQDDKPDIFGTTIIID